MICESWENAFLACLNRLVYIPYPSFFLMFFTWLACELRPISGLSAWKVTYYIAYTYKIAQIC